MILSAMVLDRSWQVVSVLAIAAQIPPFYLASTTDASKAIPAWLGILTLPGQADFILIRYSLLPWLGLSGAETHFTNNYDCLLSFLPK
jgi:hypothetical protein